MSYLPFLIFVAFPIAIALSSPIWYWRLIPSLRLLRTVAPLIDEEIISISGIGSSTFQPSDITNLPELATKLKQKPNAAVAFVSSQLSGDTVNSLKAYQGIDPNLDTLRNVLVRDLNRLVEGSLLWTEDRFKAINLRPIVGDLCHRCLEGKDLARFNRLLLEDAFPVELTKMPLLKVSIKELRAHDKTGDKVVITHHLHRLAKRVEGTMYKGLIITTLLNVLLLLFIVMNEHAKQSLQHVTSTQDIGVLQSFLITARSVPIFYLCPFTEFVALFCIIISIIFLHEQVGAVFEAAELDSDIVKVMRNHIG